MNDIAWGQTVSCHWCLLPESKQWKEYHHLTKCTSRIIERREQGLCFYLPWLSRCGVRVYQHIPSLMQIRQTSFVRSFLFPFIVFLDELQSDTLLRNIVYWRVSHNSSNLAQEKSSFFSFLSFWRNMKLNMHERKRTHTLSTNFISFIYEYQIFDCIIALHFDIRTHELVVNRLVWTSDELNILSVYRQILTWG